MFTDYINHIFFLIKIFIPVHKKKIPLKKNLTKHLKIVKNMKVVLFNLTHLTNQFFGFGRSNVVRGVCVIRHHQIWTKYLRIKCFIC